MENDNFTELNLIKTCRACLIQNDKMNSLVENNLNEMFITITNLQFEDNNEMPLQICICCTNKLQNSYNFKKQCEKSNDILLRYLANKQKCEESDSNDETECKEDTNLDDVDYEPKKVYKKRKETIQSLRLRQYSYDEVSQAIEESKRKFFENTQCIKCGFIGSNMRALSVHISHIHKEFKERWCSQCNSEFDDLPGHLVCHANDDLKCQFCSKVFTSKGHLTEHLRSHSDVRPYKCEICKKCFISSRHLKVHHRIHSKQKPYSCRYCSKSFIQRNSFKRHLKFHHGETFTCDTCKSIFVKKSDLVQHECSDLSLNTDNVAPPQNFCKECNKKVRSLPAHLKQFHTKCDEKSYKYDEGGLENKLCTVCGKQFKTNSKLKVHMRVHTGEAPYKCTYCDKRVSTRNQLVVHERTHTGERPHICSVCGKGFAQSSVLNTHMRLHTGRPELCTICGQRFCRPSELKLHMRKHTGEKPFSCTECDQSFIQRSHLMEHIKTHSDVRPYQCMYCDRAFKQNSSLKSHILIHLGHKPFRCSQCSYACRQSYSLTQHMKQHADDPPRLERPHVCIMCQKSFTTVAMLKSHTVSVHNVTYIN